MTEPKLEALEQRRLMGEQIRLLEDCILDTAKEYSIRDFHLKQAILSKSSQALWGSKRKLDVDFFEGMGQLREQIETSSWSWMAGR